MIINFYYAELAQLILSLLLALLQVNSHIAAALRPW
jgi:hypothetical protein